MSVCFYKTFCFSGKHLKNVKLCFTIIFQKLFFAFQVSKTFLCLLAFVLSCFQKFIKLLLLACALFCFSLKAYKTLILACLEVYKTSQNFFYLLALSCLKSFLKPFTNLCFKSFSKRFHKNGSLGLNRML